MKWDKSKGRFTGVGNSFSSSRLLSFEGNEYVDTQEKAAANRKKYYEELGIEPGMGEQWYQETGFIPQDRGDALRYWNELKTARGNETQQQQGQKTVQQSRLSDYSNAAPAASTRIDSMQTDAQFNANLIKSLEDFINKNQSMASKNTEVRADIRNFDERQQAAKATKDRLAQEEFSKRLVASQHLWNMPGRSFNVVNNPQEAHLAMAANKVSSAMINIANPFTPDALLVNAAIRTGGKVLSKTGNVIKNKYIDYTTVPYYHGGLPNNATLNTIDIMKPAVRQGSNYSGFFMNKGSDLKFNNSYQPLNAIGYSQKSGQGLHQLDISKKAKIVTQPINPNVSVNSPNAGWIDRMTTQQLQKYKDSGVDVLRGVARDHPINEYILLNKDLVKRFRNVKDKYPNLFGSSHK